MVTKGNPYHVVEYFIDTQDPSSYTSTVKKQYLIKYSICYWELCHESKGKNSFLNNCCLYCLYDSPDHSCL
jgi:hypothetical protein